VLDGPSGASARGEQRLLGHRGDPVPLLHRGDEGEDGGLLLIGEPGGTDGRGHAAIPPRAPVKFTQSRPIAAHTTVFWR
jgi:hypothetical protein